LGIIYGDTNGAAKSAAATCGLSVNKDLLEIRRGRGSERSLGVQIPAGPGSMTIPPGRGKLLLHEGGWGCEGDLQVSYSNAHLRRAQNRARRRLEQNFSAGLGCGTPLSSWDEGPHKGQRMGYLASGRGETDSRPGQGGSVTGRTSQRKIPEYRRRYSSATEATWMFGIWHLQTL